MTTRGAAVHLIETKTRETKMNRPRRPDQYLSFKGVMGDGPEIVIQARMCVKSKGPTYQEVGPILTLHIDASWFLADDITNTLESAWQRRVIAKEMDRLSREASAQPPLF